MSDGSAIEWTDASWNPVRGCTKVSPGCKHCYAETFAERWRGIKGHPFEHGFDLRLVPEKLDQPLRWKKPRKIFVNSMSDLFHEDVPNEFIAAVFGVMAACPQHVFQILTKRAERLPDWFDWISKQPTSDDRARITENGVMRLALTKLAHAAGPWDRFGDWARSTGDAPWPLPNVHLGVSCEDQQRADERIPHLLAVPAAVHWVSAEPLLGSIDFARVDAFRVPPWPASLAGEPKTYLNVLTGQGQRPSFAGVSIETSIEARISWIVAGGESGPGARPCDLAWVRSIVGQCKAADVPVFVKQLGAHPLHDQNDGNEWRRSSPIMKLGNRKGGDPSEWPAGEWPREMPR